MEKKLITKEEISKLLIQNGATLEQKEKENLLYDHIKSKNPNVEFIKFLIEQGIDLNQENIFKNTPLASAIDKKNRNLEVINLLLEKGANPNAEQTFLSRKKQSLLHILVQEENGPSIEKLYKTKSPIK